MLTTELKQKLNEGALDSRLVALYGEEKLNAQKERYGKAICAFEEKYGKRDAVLFSTPGRSEISGNHTDHNHGRVIAAAVDPDVIAVAARRDDGVIAVKSEGFPEDIVNAEGNLPDEKEYFTSAALLRGVAEGFLKRGMKVCGFDAYTTSNVMKGSGISSSAAFEVLIAKILSVFANNDSVPAPVLAQISQFAENVYFGKPSGLMDQTACAVGSFITIDFGTPDAKIERLSFDLEKAGYSLCITNTGGNHADLNADYASVPAEMKAVAKEFGLPVLRGLTMEQLLARAAELRTKVGDRALMRAMHFLCENERVGAQVEALRAGDLDAFLAGVLASGRSSFMYLQNVYTVLNVKEQGLSLALAVSEQLLAGRKAAWRVHGGGFAGTVQAFVPVTFAAEYKKGMEQVFGAGSCSVFRVRGEGTAVVYGE